MHGTDLCRQLCPSLGSSLDAGRLIGFPSAFKEKSRNRTILAITDLVNLQLEGLIPSSVQSTLHGATLLAISKKTGGVRPIAVGYVWRRLTASCTLPCEVSSRSSFWRQFSSVWG